MQLLIYFLLIFNICQSKSSNLFKQWMTSNNKNYQDTNEFNHRYNIWRENMKFINQQNSAGLTYKLAMNSFGDLTWQEFIQHKTGYQSGKVEKNSIRLTSDNLPKFIDWRKHGIVTRVKNQFECGSCWAFSTTGLVESYHAISTGVLVELSEENLIDCTFSYGNGGCSGGYPANALEYIIANNGIDTAKSYPLESVYGWQCLVQQMCTCLYNASTVGAKINGYKQLESGNETMLEAAVAKFGPVSVAIEATNAFQFYGSGVFVDSTCGNTESDLNHAVLAVGYDTDKNGQEYYIVKNSWGSDWGESGYVRFARNHNNMCGIATDSVFVY